MEKIISYCKRKGFIFQSSEIYGGIGGFYDFGPLGSQLKRNIKNSWWKFMVEERENVVGLDSAIISNQSVWEASGHLENFTDPLVECKNCHKRFRADHLEKNECPECKGELMDERTFNLMLKTFLGPIEDDSAIAYLRPETAQSIFFNFKNVLDTTRVKLPFGIAQIGKSFRNEITPGNFIFRTREFEQMEMEFFVKPGEEDNFFNYWIEERMRWYTEVLGIKKENLRIRKHEEDELAHYAKGCVDIEYKFSIGWSEIEGIASRTNYDLTQHEKHSGEELKYFDDQTGEKYIPYVIEPSCGVERVLLACLFDSYLEFEKGRSGEANKEIVLKIKKNISPNQIAILPLMKNKEEITKRAREIFKLLSHHFICIYDETGTVGKRYRRQDEIGTPYCVTIDFESLDDFAVTIRDRDTMEQERILIKDLISNLKQKFNV